MVAVPRVFSENERYKLFCNTAHSSIHLALVDRLVDLSGSFDVSSEGDDDPQERSFGIRWIVL